MLLNGLRVGFEAKRRQVRFLLGAPYKNTLRTVGARPKVHRVERIVCFYMVSMKTTWKDSEKVYKESGSKQGKLFLY